MRFSRDHPHCLRRKLTCAQSLNDQSKKTAALMANVERLEKLNKGLEGKLGKLVTLEEEITKLGKNKAELQEQVGQLQIRLGFAKEEVKRAKEEVESLSRKLQQAKKDNDNTEEENNDLLSRVMGYKKNAAALSTTLADNAKLTAEIQELQSKVDANGPTTEDKEVRKELRLAEGTIATLQKNLAEWTALAQVSDVGNITIAHIG